MNESQYSPKVAGMGFLKRLLGLEVRPGEPRSIRDDEFEGEIAGSDLPCFLYFYSLWCPSCQVTSGLLNELGPSYIGKASFYKMDVNKEPNTAAMFGIRSIPAVISFKNGTPADMLVGLAPIDELKGWIEKNL